MKPGPTVRVVLNGSVAGIISRGDGLRLLQTRAELQTIRALALATFAIVIDHYPI